MFYYNSNEKSWIDSLREDGWDDFQIRKYLDYRRKLAYKNSLARIGQTATTDSQMNKVYRSEWAFEKKYQLKSFETEKEAQDFAKKVLRSATWLKLLRTVDDKFRPVRVACKNYRGRTAGKAYPNGQIFLDSKTGMKDYILLHELAHAAGYFHHDAGFVAVLLKLVSRFMSREAAAILKNEFKKNKVKISVREKTAKTPEEWLAYYTRMKKARKGKK